MPIELLARGKEGWRNIGRLGAWPPKRLAVLMSGLRRALSPMRMREQCLDKNSSKARMEELEEKTTAQPILWAVAVPERGICSWRFASA